MPDQFVKDFIGHRISFVIVNEAGQWYGTLEEVGDQWIKVLVGKGKATLIPIANVRSVALEAESTETDGSHPRR
jgi:hypothetical protein